MPTLLRAGPYRLFIFMSDCHERRHVHVEGADHAAKFWLEPVSLAENLGYSPRQIHRIRAIIERERAALIQEFDAICEGVQR